MADPAPRKPVPPPSLDDDDVVQRRTFRDYYIILRERVWIALPLGLLVSISLGYYKARETPMYVASATLQFEKPETVVTSQGVVDPTVRSDADLSTYLQLLNNSSTLRERVIESLTPEEQQKLIRPALKKLKPGEPPPSPGSMLGNVSCQQNGKSYIISVTVSHPDPEAAAIVANHYVDEFMNQLEQQVGGSNDYAIGYLQNTADRLKREAEDAGTALNKYMQDHKLVSLDKSLDIVTQRLQSVNAAREGARLESLRIKNLIDQIADFQQRHADLLQIEQIASHGAIQNLRTQLNGLLQDRATLSERYLENHPKMVDVNNKIAVVRQQLDKEIGQAVDDLLTNYHSLEQNLKTLDEEYADAEKEELHLRSLSVDYDALTQQAAATKSNYQDILNRLNQTRTTRNLEEKVPMRPVDRAVPPGYPSSPNVSSIIEQSIVLGMLTFVGVAVGLSFIDDRIKSAWDVESFIGATLLGIIPELPPRKGDERHTILLEDRQAVGTEAFLSVYSAIKINSKLDFPKSILVTSTIPGEGKTLVSSNLAACFSRHGKRTLIVDCDLRRPMLHRHFKQQNSVGVITWFEKSGSVEGDLENNPHLGITKLDDNLWLLSSGGRSKSPTEMLENPLFGQLLEALKKQFDLVIVDSPPMGAVTDALLIAERTDEVVYVCRFNRAYRKHIKLYIRALVSGKNSVLGIVLNGLSPRRIEYYSNYRYYRSYKKYYGAQT